MEGTEFNIDIKVEYKGNAPRCLRDCTLEWWERSSDESNARFPWFRKGQWYDLVRETGILYPNDFSGWFTRKKICNTIEWTTLNDVPMMKLQTKPERKERLLEFRVVVRSAPNCACMYNFVELQFAQRLVRKDGKIDWSKSGFPINYKKTFG